ncbi:HEPN domain-containing protein [Aeromonas enteropelogenes]|uniref:HEPN domain-containing protein n=1 Tax=Aeromonas enteropelogenes TaxID=29489 RepID=UPI003BA15168
MNKRLNRHTKAFARWKEQTQETFEFSILICHAVPTLKRNIRLFEKGIIDELTAPDHYGAREAPDDAQRERSKEQLKEISVGYKAKLSKYILISNFSFFEAYVLDVIKEMLTFHGGIDEFIKKAKARGYQNAINDEVEETRKKIRIPSRSKNPQRYFEATRELESIKYRFPNDMFGSYGAQMFMQKLSNMKSADIPSVLKDGLHMVIPDDVVDSYHNTRDIRNKIAHGESVELSIKQVTEMSKLLKSIALQLDQHLLRYFFISENYRRN